MIEKFFALLASFIAVVLTLTFHEFAHAYAAYRSGDLTAKLEGRMTLNPTKHIDPLGAIMFALAGFGWAKPVPINPYNFNNYKKGCFWTAVAGVLTNYVMAFLFYPLLIVVILKVIPIFEGTYMAGFLLTLFSSLYAYSLGFCIFNLIPLYPLDGFRIIEAVNKKGGAIYRFLRDKGQLVLLILILVHYLANHIYYLAYIDVLGYFMLFAETILAKPIMWSWNWLLELIFY